MNYKIVEFPNTNGNNDILIAILSGIEFDSFEEKETSLTAYILEEKLNKAVLNSVLNSMPDLKSLKYNILNLENRNWNAEWESNFKPVIIDGLCTIRASFHDKANTKHEIEIEPKMAFGTGHHATTEMMISLMLQLEFENKTVLDFGTGTGILSILAEKMKAKSIFANDVEEPAFENVELNSKLNQCQKIENHLGGIEIVPSETYDIILANVNTKALSENLKFLDERLKTNGLLMLSGILIEQKEIIFKIANALNLELIDSKEKNKWTALLYQKN